MEKIKILTRVINYNACANETWLAPYVGYTVKLFQERNGVTHMLLDGAMYWRVEEEYSSEYNGWSYNIFDVTSKPGRVTYH